MPLSAESVWSVRGPERGTELKREASELTELVNVMTWKRNKPER
jgi:hypothetical protein